MSTIDPLPTVFSRYIVCCQMCEANVLHKQPTGKKAGEFHVLTYDKTATDVKCSHTTLGWHMKYLADYLRGHRCLLALENTDLISRVSKTTFNDDKNKRKCRTTKWKFEFISYSHFCCVVFLSTSGHGNKRERRWVKGNQKAPMRRWKFHFIENKQQEEIFRVLWMFCLISMSECYQHRDTMK